MKNILLFATALLLLSSCQESLEEKAAREAREVTESKCPMPIGDNMYLDSIVFDIPTLTQTQYFRFTGNSDNDSTVEKIIKNNDLKGTLVQELKNTPSYKALINKGITFRYIYGSTADTKKTYIDITVTKEDYQ
jgi:hypothetical protein